jgi:hypothetical protein
LNVPKKCRNALARRRSLRRDVKFEDFLGHKRTMAFVLAGRLLILMSTKPRRARPFKIRSADECDIANALLVCDLAEVYAIRANAALLSVFDEPGTRVLKKPKVALRCFPLCVSALVRSFQKMRAEINLIS